MQKSGLSLLGIPSWSFFTGIYHHNIIYYSLNINKKNAIANLGLEDNFSQAMRNLGYHLEDLYEQVSLIAPPYCNC
jgi:hypothetical protein